MSTEHALSNGYWYVTAFLAGFLGLTLLFEFPQTDVSRKTILDYKTVSGIVTNFDTTTKELELVTLDELKFANLTDSVYSIELKVDENSRLLDQDLISIDNEIREISEAKAAEIASLSKGDHVYVYYKATPNGFMIERVLRGSPIANISLFTPQLLELQAQVRSGQ